MAQRSRLSILAGCLLAGALCGIALFAQGNSNGVAQKRDELSDLRSVIRESEAKLKRLEARARKSREAAAESRRQAAALDSLMSLLKEREGRIAGEMIDVRRRRDSLDDLAGRMTDEYVRAARALYRRRLLAPSASMLLMPEEHRRLALAERLFARYAERQKERARTIVTLRDSLQAKDSLLAQRRDQQLALLDDRQDQMRKLESLEARYAKELRRAETEKGSLEEFIRRKNAEAKQIEQMIARLVSRAESTTAKPKSTKPSTESVKSSSARSASSKGKKSDNGTSAPSSTRSGSRSTASAESSSERSSSASSRSEERTTAFRPVWPVSGRTILHGYGERTNRRTGTVTFNPGVNIAAKSGTSVTASGPGTVSLVSWLPSYGTIVIVEHSGGWRTVYANLASAAVSEGTKVGRGSRIGTVGTSDDGEYLHFEIWRDQTRYNPATLLK